VRLRFTIVTFFFLAIGVMAQSPGGVGTGNLRGWFDASVGVTLTTGAVSTWQDRAGIGNATQGTAGERPAVSAATINYNDAVTFDGTNDNLDVIDRMATTATGVSAYAVARQTGTGNDPWGSIFNGQVNGPAWTGGGYGLVALNAGSTLEGFYVRDYNTKGVSMAVTNGVPYLISGDWNGTTANSVEAFKNGSSVGTVAYTPGSVGDAGSSWIGSGDGANTNYCFYGDIAEIAIFNTGLSSASNDKVMSYLGVKYGITLGINYTNSGGTTIYSTTGSYINNIIGITRDDGSGLIQKQSKNNDDTVRIYLSTLAASNSANSGSFASDLSHVMVGADNGKMYAASSTSAEMPAGSGIDKRLNREWKITNTNFGGTFSMDFKVSQSAAPISITASNLRLMLDDDGNFAAGNHSVIASGSNGITISYANPVITVSGISTALIASGATSFVTIGSASYATPLPVELFSFNALIDKTSVDLAWSTASEKDHDHFEIDRSANGVDFEKITSVPSKALNGNSVTRLDYEITDNDPVQGLSYYRLKQVNKDNSFSYSQPVVVDFTDQENIRFLIYPNPGHGEFSAHFSGLEKNSQIRVNLKDEKGVTVFDSFFSIGKETPTIHIVPKNKLKNGLYICTLLLGKSEYNIKVLVDD
jgi:hypothetical protein